MAWDRGMIDAPATPCRKRHITSPSSVWTLPHISDAKVKTTRDSVNSRLRPKRALSQPVQTIIVVMPTMKAVTTQAI